MITLSSVSISQIGGVKGYSIEVSIKGHKNSIHLYIGTNVKTNKISMINVRLNSAVQNAYGSLGKSFSSIEEAVNSYKGKRKEAIAEGFTTIMNQITPQEAPTKDPITVKEITVLWHEGNIEDQFEGSYKNFEEFNKTVMNQGFWKDQRGAKISLMITFTNQDNYRLRYDVENYEGNGIVDLRQRVLTYINHSKSQDWFDLQKALSSEGEAIETRKQLALIEQYIHNTPVKSVEEAVKSVNLHTTPKEPTPAQRNEIIATLMYQSQIHAIKLTVKILQVRLEEALEIVAKLSREIEPSQA